MSLFFSSFSSETESFQPKPPNHPVAGVLVLHEAARFRMDAHTGRTVSIPNGWLILACLDGSPHLSAPSLTCVLPQGHACIFPAAAVTLNVSGTPAELLALHLDGSAADALLSPAAQESAFFYPNGAAAAHEVFAALHTAAKNDLDITGHAASLQVYAMLLHLVGTAGDPADTPVYPPLVSAAIALIQEQFAHLSGINELAELLEVSPAHLIRQFTRSVGMTPGKFLTRVRIEHAKLLLCDPDMSVQTAAEAAGFSGAGYFIKVFRRETGLTPGQYIASAADHPVPHVLRREEHYLY